MHPTILINLVFGGAILSALAVGTYFDLKTRQVSNKITGLVWLLSLPLVYLNIPNITVVPFIFIVLFWILYHQNIMGGADLKALIPLVFILPEPIIFITLITTFGIIYAIISRNQKIPFFMPIVCAYGLILFNLIT